jgi:hypothetical protein
MKKVVLTLVLVAMLALTVSVASAAPESYETGFQVANLSSETANVTMTFYNASGGTPIVVSDSIAANSSNTYFPLSDPGSVNLPSGFAGSAVISSDQPVAAIVNVLGDGTAGASAGGFDGGSTSVSLPLVAKNQVGVYDTWFHVQNAGSASTTVNVAYAGTSCTDSATVAAGAAAKFDQGADTCLPDGHVGAATITSTSEPIVATVIETSANDTGLFAYNGFTGGSETVAIPLAQFNNAGYHSGIQIQNTGDASVEVTVAYAPAGAGAACTESGTIAAGASATFGLGAFSLDLGDDGLTDNCAFGSTFVGSATATSSGGSLVAIINQTNLTQYASAYNGFDPASATTSVNMPLIMDRNSGFFTGFNVQNVGDASTDVTCTFSGSAVTVSDTLGAGEALNDLQLDKIADGYVGSATCTSTGEPILAVVNQLNTAASTDFLFTYEGVNQ